MCPAGPSASSSTRLARPFQTLRTTVVPSYSTQVVEPIRGWTRRFRWVFQVPISKSKSRCPSRTLAAAGTAGFAASGFWAARAESAGSAAARHEARRRRRLRETIIATPRLVRPSRVLRVNYAVSMAIRKNAPAGTYRRSARRNPVTDCPLTAAFAAVGGKWKLIIVYWLAQEDLHFAGLQR